MGWLILIARLTSTFAQVLMMAHPFDWIDTDNVDQLKWIGDYLRRRKSTDSSLYLIADHTYGYNSMANALKSLPNDAKNRELSRQTKGALQTHEYRKKNGNPISLLMPNGTLKKLNALAKKRGQTQGNTLFQIITNASDDQKLAATQAREDRKKFTAQLKRQREATQDIEHTYQNVINRLLSALSEEVSHRCQLEAIIGELDNSQMDSEEAEAYHYLVERRISELDSSLMDLKLISAKVRPLNEWMQEQAKLIGLVKDSGDASSSNS